MRVADIKKLVAVCLYYANIKWVLVWLAIGGGKVMNPNLKAGLSIVIFFTALPANAYVDPGTGSMAIQMLVGGLLAAGFMLKTYYYQLKRRINKMLGRSTGTDPDGASVDSTGPEVVKSDPDKQWHLGVLLNDSGLHESLVTQSALIEPEIVSDEFAATDGVKCVIKPQIIETISYPYERRFIQLNYATRAISISAE